jgi:hypothetical protein
VGQEKRVREDTGRVRSIRKRIRGESRESHDCEKGKRKRRKRREEMG